jgi:hypothetical protein
MEGGDNACRSGRGSQERGWCQQEGRGSVGRDGSYGWERVVGFEARWREMREEEVVAGSSHEENESETST